MVGRRVLSAAVIATGLAAVPVYRGLPAGEWVPDLLVAVAAIVLALWSWRRPVAISSLALGLAATWWAGTTWPWALYLHRGVLIHALVALPHWWPRRRPSAAVVIAAYVVSVFGGLWQIPLVAWAVSVALVVSTWSRSARRERARPLAAALVGVAVCGPVLVVHSARAQVATYDVLVTAVLVVLGVLVHAPGRHELADLAVQLPAAQVQDPTALLALVRTEPGLVGEPLVRDALATAEQLHAGNERVRLQAGSALRDAAAARRRLVVTEATERHRLAIDLHAAVSLPLQQLAVRAARVGVGELALTRAADSLDRALSGMRPPDLDDGLHRAISAIPLVSALGAELDLDPTPCDDLVVEDVLYAVAVETLGNIAKHAGPCTVTIVHRLTDAAATLTVADTGRGGIDRRAGSGLEGLVDRVEALGGVLEVVSEPGSGSTITAVVPRQVRGDAPRRRSEADTPRPV